MSEAPVDVTTYVALLAEQLRLSGVTEERVREIAADVRSHVQETCEDPVKAFGQPAEYALEWATSPSWRRVAGQVGLRATGVLGVLVLLKAAFATEDDWAEGVPLTTGDATYAFVWVVVFVGVPWTVDVWLSARAARSAGEVRRTPDWAIRLAAVVAVITITMLALTVADVPEGRPATRSGRSTVAACRRGPAHGPVVLSGQ